MVRKGSPLACSIECVSRKSLRPTRSKAFGVNIFIIVYSGTRIETGRDLRAGILVPEHKYLYYFPAKQRNGPEEDGSCLIHASLYSALARRYTIEQEIKHCLHWRVSGVKSKRDGEGGDIIE